MLGLIRKDIFVSKKQAKFVGGLSVILIFQAIITEDLSILTAIAAMMPFTILMSSFAYDDMMNFNRYALTFPVSKLDIVLSKYFFVGSLHTVVGVVLFVLNMLFAPDQEMSMFLLKNTLLISIILSLLILPLNFKFGAEKSRYVLIIFLIVPSTLNIFATFDTSDYEQLLLNVLNALPIFTGTLLLISIALSFFIVRGKEF